MPAEGAQISCPLVHLLQCIASALPGAGAQVTSPGVGCMLVTALLAVDAHLKAWKINNREREVKCHGAQVPEPLTGPAIVAMGVLWTVLGVALLAAALSMQDFASLYALLVCAWTALMPTAVCMGVAAACGRPLIGRSSGPTFLCIALDQEAACEQA